MERDREGGSGTRERKFELYGYSGNSRREPKRWCGIHLRVRESTIRKIDREWREMRASEKT